MRGMKRRMKARRWRRARREELEGVELMPPARGKVLGGVTALGGRGGGDARL